MPVLSAVVVVVPFTGDVLLGQNAMMKLLCQYIFNTDYRLNVLIICTTMIHGRKGYRKDMILGKI